MNLPKDEGKELVEESLIAQVVALSLQQVPEYKISEQLNLSRYKVRKMRNSAEFKALISDISAQAKQAAAASFLAKIESLAPLAYSALKKNLEDDKLDAVRVFVEVAGLKDRTEEKPQDASITIVMPGASTDQVIEVKNESNE